MNKRLLLLSTLLSLAPKPASRLRGSQSIATGILLAIFTIIIAALALTNKSGWEINFPLKSLSGGKPIKADTVSTRLKVADAYSIELFADNLKGPRLLQFTPSGHLIVSQPGAGEILIFHRQAKGNLSSTPSVLMSNLTRPHGIDIYQHWLYVAEMHRVIRIPFDDASGSVSGSIEVLVSDLPTGGNHRSRSLQFGPDGKMYVSIGSSCNVCIESNPYRASIWRFKPDGSDGQLFASGLRNSVGLAWSPRGSLYATDNGRDLLGDELPADELNRIEAGAFYGWPFYYSHQGETVMDADLKHPELKQNAVTLPAYEFRAHNAPLGLHFLQSPRHPEQYQNALAVALHGSWNKSYKDGYKVVLLSNVEATTHDSDSDSTPKDKNIKINTMDFVWGFLEDDQVIGRPVDIAEDDEGTLYLSDDYGGAVYKIMLKKQNLQNY